MHEHNYYGEQYGKQYYYGEQYYHGEHGEHYYYGKQLNASHYSNNCNEYNYLGKQGNIIIAAKLMTPIRNKEDHRSDIG